MKKLILTIAILLTVLITKAQTELKPQPISYEATNWKTRLLDNPQQIKIDAPPDASQAKAELKIVNERLKKLDEAKIQEIKYWDSGAPSYRWNQIYQKLIGGKMELLLRMPSAWMNIAIYDATILAWKEKVKYKRSRPEILHPAIKAPLTYSYPCEHSVTAAVAANVLAYFFPEKADSILQLAKAASQSRINAGVQFPSDVEAGWKLGEEVAKQIIEKAKNDGSDKVWNGEVNKDPKKWTGAFPMGINAQLLTPIILRSAGQFRPPAPPDFENEMKDMKNFKQTFKTKSTAFYWANTADAWGEAANQKMFEYRMSDDAPTVARIYCVISTAMHEMAIAIMDAKYAYWGIRPNQYDTTYKSLIPTPPFPGYPSGHAAGAGTLSTILEYFFPADKKQFQQMAQECADSRFYAGIHFRTDNETGLSMGRELGKYIIDEWMRE